MKTLELMGFILILQLQMKPEVHYAKLQIQRFNEVIRSLQRLEINYGLVSRGK